MQRSRKYYEVGGKLYEATVGASLDLLKKYGIHYEWNKPYRELHILPDFLLYRDQKPYMNILVSHSTSVPSGKMKFWRNVEELFETKILRLECSNVIFSSKKGWSKGALKIMDDIFDGNIVVFNRPYGPDLLNTLHKLISYAEGFSFKQAKQLIVTSYQNAGKFKGAFSKFHADIKEMILNLTLKPELRKLWEMEQSFARKRNEKFARMAHEDFSLKRTYFKRGVCKAVVLYGWELDLIAELEERFSSSSLRTIASQSDSRKFLNHLQCLDFITERRTLAGLNYDLDEELYFALNNLGRKPISAVYRYLSQTHEGFSDYISILRDPSIAEKMFSILIEDNTINASRIQELAIDAFRHGHIESVKDGRVWPIDLLITTIRICQPRSRYSINVLCDEAGLSTFGGISPVPRFIRRERALEDEKLEVISKILSERINVITRKKVLGKKQEIIKEHVTTRMSSFVKHRNINPLHALIGMWLKKSNYPFDGYPEDITEHACLSSYSEVGKQTASSTYAFRVNVKKDKYILLHQISAYGKGNVGHKKLELAGRVRTVRYSWDQKNRAFVPRKDVLGHILIIDGTWDAVGEDSLKIIQLLYESGWDMVAYPDEMVRIFKELEKLIGCSQDLKT